MNVQGTVRRIRAQEWTQQIAECEGSGLSIRQWCEINGLSTKTYYYRRRRVREELLESIESCETTQLSKWTPAQMETPTFAAIPIRRKNGTAVTVQIGLHVVDIHNGADAETVESVLRTLIRL